jgi:hypothetical protein
MSTTIHILAVLERQCCETLKTLIIGGMKNSCLALMEQSFGRVSELPSECTNEVPNLLFLINGFHFTVCLYFVKVTRLIRLFAMPEGRGCYSI